MQAITRIIFQQISQRLGVTHNYSFNSVSYCPYEGYSISIYSNIILIIPAVCRPVFYQVAGHRAGAWGQLVGGGDGETCQMHQLETESSDREENLQFQTVEMNHPPPQLALQIIISVKSTPWFLLTVSLVCDFWWSSFDNLLEEGARELSIELVK